MQMMKNNLIKRLLVLCLCLSLIIDISGNTSKILAATATNTANTQETVTFDPQGGTVGTTQITATLGQKYGTLPVPTKVNYVFRGWFTFPSGGTMINADKLVRIAKNHTLYAQWNGKDFTLALDANGGTLLSSSVTVRYGTKYLGQLPIPTRANYVFSGWYTDKSKGSKITSSTEYKDNPPKKLYARWTERVLTIKFIAFNGETYEKEVTCGKTFGTLPTPVRTGFTFKGWYIWDDVSKSDASPIVSTTPVTDESPQLLFARWY